MSRYHIIQLFGSFVSVGSYILFCYLFNVTLFPDWKFGLLILGVGVSGIAVVSVTNEILERRQDNG